MTRGFVLVLGLSLGAVACGDDNSNPANPPAETSAMYLRLGGKDGIRTLLGKVVAAELADPEIASFFPYTPGAPGNGHPAGGAILECFTNQLGVVAKGPASEVSYPTVVDNGGTPFTCRDMVASHEGLGIYASVFDKFVSVGAGVLQANGVSADDITAIAAALNGTKPDIVTSDRTDHDGYQGDAP